MNESGKQSIPGGALRDIAYHIDRAEFDLRQVQDAISVGVDLTSRISAKDDAAGRIQDKALSILALVDHRIDSLRREFAKIVSILEPDQQ